MSAPAISLLWFVVFVGWFWVIVPPFFFRLVIQFRMLIFAAFIFWFVRFDGRAVLANKEVISDGFYLPRHFHIRFAGANLEPIVCDFSGHFCQHEVVTAIHNCELIAEIPIDLFKVVRERNPSIAICSCAYNSVVYILRFRSFGAIVMQVFVFRVKRTIYAERFGSACTEVSIAVNTLIGSAIA